jgi:uncharacterized surface protein with fasciclin (FAS1) repeats
MKTNKINGMKFNVRILLLASIVGWIACNDPNAGKNYATSEVPMIDDYLSEEDSSLTEFAAIVEKAGFQGTLHAYGAYTCFAPTNEAIHAWCQEQYGVSSWQVLPTIALDSMVRFHLVNDTISTEDFEDGRLSSPNGLKKYITTITKIDATDNTAYIEVNRQARIIEKDIHAENGIIHKIDAVLTPNSNTVWQAIKSEFPSNEYSIFVAALEQSGMDTILNKQEDDASWYTLLAETDEVFQAAGITTVDQLIDSMAVIRSDVVQRKNLLALFVNYHVVPALAYVADFMKVSTEETLVDGEVITVKVSQLDVILNRFTDTENPDPGVLINRDVDYTDFSCHNGVIHTLEGFMPPRIREAVPVYWDVAEQPELTALKDFRKDGTTLTFTEGELSELSFEAATSGKGITYACSKVFGLKYQYVNYDYLYFGVNPSELTWVEMKTPLLIAGTYKVWVCWRRVDYVMTFRSSFKQDGYDDQVFPNVYSTYDYLPTGQTLVQLLNSGWKYYVAKQPYSNSSRGVGDDGKVFVSRLLGTITVYKTGRHILRFEGLTGSNKVYWDMIHFIPVDDVQIWPRFDVGGNEIYEDTPCNEILPYDQACSSNN